MTAKLAILIAAAAVGTARTESVYSIADELGLIPTPREISVAGGSRPLAGWRIAVPPGLALAQVGAEEINSRIVELGGAALSVSAGTGPAIYIGRWCDPGIRALSAALKVSLTPVDPGEQGYVIRFGTFRAQPAVLLGGSDAAGALYACVTFRSLLRREGNGVAARIADVRDWPDFKIRNVGHLTLRGLAAASDSRALAEAVAEARREVDFLLRHKINAAAAPFVDPEAPWRAAAVDVLRYAAARGITLRFGGGVDVGAYLTPEQRKTAVERKPGTAYEWAAFDAHRAHAARYAGFLAAVGSGLFSLHPYDGGGYADPEMWSRRSASAHAMYGDDRQRASLEQFLIYFTAVRDRCPDAALEAVVYPYHFQFARPEFPERFAEWNTGMPMDGWFAGMSGPADARRVQDKLSAYHRYMAAHLPAGAGIVFREAGREEFLAAAGLYGLRPITVWIYPDRNRGWQGTFCPQVRMAKTFFIPGRRDRYFVAAGWPGSDSRVQRLAQIEYLWNTDRPDASDRFVTWSRFYEREGRHVTAFQREHLIPRIARILYGDAAAFRELLAANVSFGYVMDPEGVGQTAFDTECLDIPRKYLAGQADAFERIHALFAPLASRDGSRWTRFYYRYTGLAAIKARLETQLDECRRLPSPESVRLAREVLAAIPALAARCDAIRVGSKGGRSARLEGLDRFSPFSMKPQFDKLAGAK